jgi:TolB protein
MTMKQLLLLSTLAICLTASGQSPVGIFQTTADIGSPKNAGSTVYDETTQSYTMKGAGYNVWFNRDEFQYAYNKIKGDFILTANVELRGSGKPNHRKVGWMVRYNDTPESAHASATLHGDGLISLQWRELRGAFMRDPQDQIVFPKKKLSVMQLERTGSKITMRVASWGEPLQTVGSHEMDNMPEEVLAGLFLCSHDPEVVEEARIWNVRIDKPVEDNYNARRDGYLGCRLEILSVFDGNRKVIHQSATRFEAPNWMPDGKKLLFNEGGSLYKIPIEGGTPEKLNTDFADRNNNDHGISFDGKLLAISHQVQGQPGGGSTVYVLPLTGGTPKQVTQKTPSYWHGWNPNNKEVAYVGMREGNQVFNLYKMNINGGAEVALTTNTSGHVDGPEYSPDGKFIYYNGNETGTMQLWRMKPDGTGKEQITFDEYHNWFPHISPDGKWIAYISFPPDIAPNSHPSYKRVTLRLIPVSGGAPKVIAYLYGGQGTINVPSWSPDSKQIAFVSNSGKE